MPISPSPRNSTTSGTRRQHAFRPAVDEWGATSEPGVLVAGDGAHILGAEAAVESGRIAAFESAYRLGRIRVQHREVLAKPHRASLARHRRFREFLDFAFEPGAAALRPSDPAVTVCRCEEVTVAEIERVVALGCPGPNQAKAFTRCGMGPCQGRMCATVVSEMFAERRHAGVGAVGHYRIRPPVKPLTVGELAALEGTGTAPANRPSTPMRPKCTLRREPPVSIPQNQCGECQRGRASRLRGLGGHSPTPCISQA